VSAEHAPPSPAPVIGVGWTVWSTAHMNADGFARSGVVVDVVERLDPETGELARTYATVEYSRGRVHRLDVAADDVGESVESREAVVRDLVEWINRELAEHHRKRPDVWLQRAALRLVEHMAARWPR
jgi:hypothetical protein